MINMINLAMLLSGGERTLHDFLERIRAGTLDGQAQAVIGSCTDVCDLDRAKVAEIPDTAY